MAKLFIESVSISWGISRGRDTYGWNICRAVSRDTGKTYRTTGGGYDMTGTVIGDWFAAERQGELLQLVKDKMRDPAQFEDAGYQVKGYIKFPGLYGMTYNTNNGKVHIDGGCGIESVLRIIESCGFEYQRQYNPKTKSKSTTGYLFSKEITE